MLDASTYPTVATSSPTFKSAHTVIMPSRSSTSRDEFYRSPWHTTSVPAQDGTDDHGWDSIPVPVARTPPRLPFEHTIALPHIPGPIEINEILSCDYAVDWDISSSPSEARAAAGLRSTRNMLNAGDIFDVPASAPAISGVITVRISSLTQQNVFVSSNTETSSRVVTVWDVILAVYRNVRVEALRTAGLSQLQSYSRFYNPAPSPSSWWDGSRQRQAELNEEQVVWEIRRHMKGMTRWIGLCQSVTEDNMWILKTGRGDYW